MTTVAVVGMQWGDEGKGKITDFLAQHAEMVVRCQGGNNAGHTVHTPDGMYKLHLLPAGVLHSRVRCLIGNGVVLDPLALVEEIMIMEGALGKPIDNLFISERAHLILSTHCWMDSAEEKIRSQDRIGTTGRGIGPAYGDKVARVGLRAADMQDVDSFLQKLRIAWQTHVAKQSLYGCSAPPPVLDDRVEEAYRQAAHRLSPHLTDVSWLLHQGLKEGRDILFEGAQGAMLDLDHGTYPFVTSSHPSVGGICVGAGVGLQCIQRVLGVVKAYTTRVGDGPFPTELQGGIAEHIREVGKEYGATTGRPRRVGWFDAFAAQHACRVNGITDLAVHCLDVLTGLDEIGICVGYGQRGRSLVSYPARCEQIAECEPVYEMWPGWHEPIDQARSLAELPVAAQRYLGRLSELLQVPLTTLSVGSYREATLVLRPLFSSMDPLFSPVEG
ncbi:adenylosuccinate synthase [Pasteuria penetrans]|uniref:adenylosuccinate synthase n=1 Tax=Pasteuria penetrans TaxID=86005 RepID=UPI000FA074A4|nr:adenylosuccinate synthase [Pasteuria penetrans]